MVDPISIITAVAAAAKVVQQGMELLQQPTITIEQLTALQRQTALSSSAFDSAVAAAKLRLGQSATDTTTTATNVVPLHESDPSR